MWLLLAKLGQSTMFPICLDFEEQDPLGCFGTHDMQKCIGLMLILMIVFWPYILLWRPCLISSRK
jgi:hypothetical protein